MSAARSLALLIALVAAVAVAAQFLVASRLPELGSLIAVLWRMAGYFTILTNLAIFLHFAAVAAGGRMKPGRAGGLVVWIGMVGIVYHAVLSGLWAPQGLAWWADQGLHSATPLLTVLWWLAFAERTRPDLAQVARWLLWPLAYLGYAVARGAVTGFWPYPFLDPARHGAVRVGLNIAALMLGFAVLAVLIAAFDRRRFSR